MQAVTVESRLLWTGICFCFTLWNCACGICSLLSVLCCTTGIFHFVAELSLRHLDYFFSSPLGRWDSSLHRHSNVNNLVDELRLGTSTVFCVSRAVGTCVCVLMWGQLHHCVSSKIGSGISTSMICSTIHTDESFVCKQPSSLVCSMSHNSLHGSPTCIEF